MSRFLNACYQGLEAYVPGEQPTDMAYIKLNTNESPYPPSDAVIAAVTKEETEKLRLYPDPECGALRDALAESFHTSRENIFVSNGSDDILNFAFMAFAGLGGKAVFPSITYGFYKVFSQLHGIDYETISLNKDFTISPEDYYHKNALVVIANPNAPTGLILSTEQVEAIVKNNPDNVVLIDEAYIDFGGTSCAPLVSEYDNLLVVQTFSKSRSMAGMRIGYAISNPTLIKYLNDAKYSFNSYTMNQAALVCGAEAVKDKVYFEETVQKIVETREWSVEQFKELGFQCLDSQANFIFVTHPEYDAKEMFEALKKEDIYVRFWGSERIEQYMRVTVGTREEMEALFAFLRRYIKGE